MSNAIHFETIGGKPAARPFPKEGYFTLEQGRYRPTPHGRRLSRLPTIIAKIKPAPKARSPRIARRSKTRIARSPHALAPLQLPYLRWVLFDIGPPVTSLPWHFRYRFDK